MPRSPAADQIIATLGLQPLPHEGGFFRATERTAHVSAIYFLLTPDDFSAFHRLAQDEFWHFHAGDAVEHVQLTARGARVTTLGADILAGAQPQVLVRAGIWQAARLAAGARHGYALLGCTVAPPWDERGFDLAQRAALAAEFPAERKWIDLLTR